MFYSDVTDVLFWTPPMFFSDVTDVWFFEFTDVLQEGVGFLLKTTYAQQVVGTVTDFRTPEVVLRLRQQVLAGVVGCSGSVGVALVQLGGL